MTSKLVLGLVLLTAAVFALPANAGTNTGIAAAGGTYATPVALSDASPSPTSPVLVVFQNADLLPHTVTSSAGGFNTGVVPGGATTTFAAPTSPGQYQFFCALHPWMQGVLVVGSGV